MKQDKIKHSLGVLSDKVFAASNVEFAQANKKSYDGKEANRVTIDEVVMFGNPTDPHNPDDITGVLEGQKDKEFEALIMLLDRENHDKQVGVPKWCIELMTYMEAISITPKELIDQHREATKKGIKTKKEKQPNDYRKYDRNKLKLEKGE